MRGVIMENKTKKNLATGIIAAGVGLTTAALHELLLSKEDHDKKEREISKIEKEKKWLLSSALPFLHLSCYSLYSESLAILSTLRHFY
jgi:hypothetical protein